MKNIFGIVILIGLLSIGFKNYGSAQTGNTFRIFFQTTSGDGSMRFTGCVNTGGSCYSEEEVVVQDCLEWGSWSPCGWE